MHISKVQVKNFRLLQNTSLDLREELSLLIGRNNTGKTSLIVLFDNFFKSKPFHYDDFPISLRDKINGINAETVIDDLSIQMIIHIEYNDKDDLANLSELILDLNPSISTVKILFESRIKKDALLADTIDLQGDEKKIFISKNLHRYLDTKIYSFDDSVREEKELNNIKNVINVQIIPARRSVASSEDGHGGKKPLSALSSDYFSEVNDEPNEELAEINSLVAVVDNQLDDKYIPFFDPFLKSAKKFLNEDNLRVVSDIQSKNLLLNSSKVIYGDNDSHLPEHLNGLGVMNILHLLLKIEMKATDFKKNNKDINLLFIEEPEAHTHPQMQYVFAKEIKPLLKKIDHLQTLITSHSSHIVSQSDFKDIRYLKRDDSEDDVQFKNFHTELSKSYTNGKEFDFLNKYITLQASDLFFASKVIFIEGLTERMLLPYFMQRTDAEHEEEKNYDPLSSQNISILEVGANAKVFAPFIDFLGVKTLIITDIDGTEKIEKEKDGKTRISYQACPTEKATHTSNETLKHFFKAPESVSSDKFMKWFKGVVEKPQSSTSKNIKIAYQGLEDDYHARSFEDSFVSINKEEIHKAIKDDTIEIFGLKKTNAFDDPAIDNPYKLIEEVLDKKSDFASSLLYLALVEGILWQTPSYIEEGLTWLSKD